MQSLAAALLTSTAHASRLLTGLVLVKVIAVYLGPEGMGRLGHFMNVVTILSMLAGGGILNGVMKYVAEYRQNPQELLGFVSGASSYALIASMLIMIMGILFSEQISLVIFATSEYAVFICIAFSAQACFAFSNLVNGVANGLGRQRVFAIIQILGNLLAIPIIWGLVHYYGFRGAAIAIIAASSLYFFPAFYFFYRSSFWGKIVISFKDFKYFRQLLSFTAILIASVVSFPVIEIVVREMIIRGGGYDQAGIWQASIRLSGAYLGFFGVFLVYYFMPLVSPEQDRALIAKHVMKHALAIGGVFLVGAVSFYAGRTYFIPMVLSEGFSELYALIQFQLIGDFFKILSWVIGVVGVAKASVRLCVSAEIFQNGTFFLISSLLYSQRQSVESILFAHIITYIIYFGICCVILAYYVRMGTRIPAHR